jgi:hypothetical protein
MCHLLTFLSYLDNISFFLFVFVGEFQQERYANMWGHYGPKVMGIYSGLLAWHQAQLSISFADICFFYGGLCPIYFFRNWVLVALYLSSKFCVFDKLVLE